MAHLRDGENGDTSDLYLESLPPEFFGKTDKSWNLVGQLEARMFKMFTHLF
jgi:hypothetical protein